MWYGHGFGACGATIMLVPACQAARDGGHTGTFTLTEPNSCDRYPPPRQRCGWFGDIVSDDPTTVRRHMELADGLPRGAKAGQVDLALKANGEEDEQYADRSVPHLLTNLPSRATYEMVLEAALTEG